jgi:hypothetical protein
MRRAIPLLAVLCTGVALGALVVAMIGGGRLQTGLNEEAAPLDPTAAMPEIAQLRESRGSILAGTSLAAGGDAADFSAALAQQSGAALPAAAAPEQLVELLRRSAGEYEEHAARLESDQEYSRADQLRRLADDARRAARSLLGVEPVQASAPATYERR